MPVDTKSLTAANIFSDGIYVEGVFDFSLVGAWIGDVTVQRRRDDADYWEDVESFNSNGVYPGEDVESKTKVRYRFGFKTGDYTSGIAKGRISSKLPVTHLV